MRLRNIRDIFRYVYYKLKMPNLNLLWKGDYIELTINKVRIKYPCGINNLQKKNFFYHLSNFEFPDVNLFCSDLMGYFIEYNPKEGDTVIDAGAFTGVFSVYCSVLVGKNGNILAFEPNKDSVILFRKALALNSIKNVILIEKGLWSNKKNLSFKDKGVCSKISKNGDYIIPVTTIDLELRSRMIRPNRVNFVKMDIEGAEIEAVQGMKGLLKKGNPHLAIASYHIVNGIKTYSFIEKYLKSNGYSVFTSYLPHLTTYAKKNESKE